MRRFFGGFGVLICAVAVLIEVVFLILGLDSA
jgi:hypothetical protein